MSEEPGGIIVDGLYVPPIGLHGFKHLGEGVWGPRPEDKIGRLRCLGENWSERRALVETLHYRGKAEQYFGLIKAPTVETSTWRRGGWRQEYEGNWAPKEEPTTSEEFELLRRLGPRIGNRNWARMRHLEGHLKAGDVFCRCGMERSQAPTDSEH